VKRTTLVSLVLLVLAPRLSAQVRADPSAMGRADSAWRSGDHKRARVLYREVLATDSTASRAVFRLAQLAESDERALVLYRRYIVLEPDDPWGHMAEGDLLARMGHIEEALVAYEGAHAIAPGGGRVRGVDDCASG
jgi:Flp pilus assembly protein TadD